MYVYPRLDSASALALLSEYSLLTISELKEHSALEHSRSQWYPTAPSRASVDVLGRVQSIVRQVAEAYGYPNPQPERSPRFTPFDQQIGPQLYNVMQIVPADAAHEGVWSFLSLVLLPDVAFWRFPNRKLREEYERILGRPRNVFRRLWWRCFAFGVDPEGPSSSLLEDEAVGIMERPTLGGDPRVASAIARTHLMLVRQYPSVPRTELMRDASKRIRRLSSVVTLSALNDSELDLAVGETFSAAVAALTR